jgi:hypothetical protein
MLTSPNVIVPDQKGLEETFSSCVSGNFLSLLFAVGFKALG